LIVGFWQAMKWLAHRTKIENHRRIKCDGRQGGQCRIVATLISITLGTTQRNLSAAGERGDVEDLQMLGSS